MGDKYEYFIKEQPVIRIDTALWQRIEKYRRKNRKNAENAVTGGFF